MNKLVVAIKSVYQLGLKQSLLYGLYRLGLLSGHYRRTTPSSFYLPIPDFSSENVIWPFQVPKNNVLQRILSFGDKDLLKEADEILNGRYHFFGGKADHFSFKNNTHVDLPHWSAYELGKASVESRDIKLVWEPARFGWAFTLARAYSISDKETYAQCFWQHFDEFTNANPFNCGPNWSSAQEVAPSLNCVDFCRFNFQRIQISHTPAHVDAPGINIHACQTYSTNPGLRPRSK